MTSPDVKDNVCHVNPLTVSLQSLGSGLQDLLDYEGDVENEMMCNFTIGYTDMFGSSLTKQLKENGAEITVTNENRQVRVLDREVLKGNVIIFLWWIDMYMYTQCTNVTFSFKNGLEEGRVRT